MARNSMPDPAQSRAKACEEGAPPRARLPLKTAENVRAELARLYREGKTGRRDISDVSKLANVLQILGRMIETEDLESRLEKLERQES
jgi:hypothetical protein